MHDAPYGRDPRRKLSPDEARFIYERADGQCRRCGTELGPDWHQAHLVSWIHGGATSVDQEEAWCMRCNLRQGPRDAENAPAFTPRDWQQRALWPLLQDIAQHGVATLHAAPGAGKTLEAAWVFKALYDAGVVRRLLVVVPTTPLIDQWVDNLGLVGIHLDKAPRNGFIELEGTVGAVVCYASLRTQTARCHATRMDQRPTLVVWDEVHHLAEKAAWGNAAQIMVGKAGDGQVEHAAAVLNITGTLFRSNSSQQIATVPYQKVMTDEGEKIQAKPTWSVTTANLLGVELRRPDLYVYSGQAQLVDLHTEDVVTGDIADLDKQQRQAIMRESFLSKQWLRGFCQEAVVLLRRQIQTPVGEEEPLKLLYIAQNQRAAKMAADMLNQITNQDFARLIISDEPGAITKLKAAKRERRSCAIVAVQMVTEGFDCNHIATTAYASNRTASLFIAQAMARNMRVTETERADRRMLPAQILIPDNPDLRKAFASALANAVHEIQAVEQCGRCSLPREACRCEAPTTSGARLPRYALLDLDDPRLRSAVVLGHDDGEVDGKELIEQWIPACNDLGIWETLAPRVAVAAKRVRPQVRIYAEPEEPAETQATAVRTKANPRDLNLAFRAQCHQAARWMSVHIGHDSRYDAIGAFQTAANKAAGIPFDSAGKGMQDLASPQQLRDRAEWMRARIAEHCRAHDDCHEPSWLRGDE
jgi:superfamily II DNA or RNA helicase